MNLDWILSPAMQGAIMTASFLGSLAIWISTKMETRAAWRELALLRTSTGEKIEDLMAQLRILQAAPVGEIGPAPSFFMAVQGLNLTARTKVLRMHLRGETTSSIAAALGVQYEEVALVLKLDRMLEVSALVTQPSAGPPLLTN